jgi:hypothetical protein
LGWGYLLSAQRRHGTRSYSTTSPSRSLLGLDNAAKEDPAIHAGVGALEAGVVSLYSVVVIIGGWVRVGCARLLCGHCGPLPFGLEVPVCFGRRRGLVFVYTTLYDI